MNDDKVTIITASGATYHLCGSRIARSRGADSAPLRADGAPIEVLAAAVPVVGERWVLLLGAGDRTWTRVTSPVVAIALAEHDDDNPGT